MLYVEDHPVTVLLMQAIFQQRPGLNLVERCRSSNRNAPPVQTVPHQPGTARLGACRPEGFPAPQGRAENGQPHVTHEAAGGFTSASAGAFYGELAQSSWALQAWLFSPVWTVLCLFLGAVHGWYGTRRFFSAPAPALRGRCPSSNCRSTRF